MTVWTVGHSTHSLDVFVKLLNVHEIALLVDVRTAPNSRRHPHFGAEALATSLPDRGMALEQRTVMMCAEALWWRCHRRLIADRLVVSGDTVCHIGSDGHADTHCLSAFAAVDAAGGVTYPAA